MPIPIRCPTCQHTGSVPDNYAGAHLRCPKCRAKFRVEAPTTAPDDATLLVEPDELLPPISAVQPAAQPVFPVSLPASASISEQTRCPYCSELIQRAARKCKHCNEWLDPSMRKDAVQTMSGGVVIDQPPGQFDLPAGYAPAPVQVPQQERKPILSGAVFGLVLSVILGLMLSQFWPIFGGVIERGLAEPFSPARLSLIPIHVFALGFVGALLGGSAGAFLEYQARQTACPVGMLIVVFGSCGGCLMGGPHRGIDFRRQAGRSLLMGTARRMMTRICSASKSPSLARSSW